MIVPARPTRPIRPIQFIIFARPMVLSQLLMISISLTDVLVLGLLGPAAMSSGGLINSYVFVAILGITGFAFAVIPVNGAFYAKGDKPGMNLHFRAGLVLFTGLGAFACLVIFFVDRLAIMTGISETIFEGTRLFRTLIAVACVPAAITIFLRHYLISIQRAARLDLFYAIAFGLNLFCNLLLTGFITPDISMGMAGIAAATVLTYLFLIGVFLREIIKSRQIMLFQRETNSLQTILKTSQNLFRHGLPIALILTVETTLVSSSYWLMGQFGSTQLAMHGWFMLLFDIVFMFPVGLSQALSSRLATHQCDALGKSHHNTHITEALIASMATILVVSTLIVCGVTVLSLHPGILPAQNTQEILTLLVRSIAYLPVLALASGLVILLAAILRTLDHKTTFNIHILIGYWGIGIGVSYGVMTFTPLGWTGIYIGMILGFGYSAVGLALNCRRARLSSPATSG
jgi:MATE family multidrug resistance protein